MSSTATLPAGPHTAPHTPSKERRTVAVVSTAHGCSHFFHLILAPLFPWIKAEFALSYAELGLLMTVFFVVSGVGQALAGFVVDRIGAVPVMLAALCSFVIATLVLSSAPSYTLLMVGSVFAGLGNAPFHPVDYSILNARIAPTRLAKAYALHGVAGNLGWALAPVFLVGITGLSNWRTAVACAGLLAAAVLLMVWLHRELLAGQPVGALGIVHAQPVDATTQADSPSALAFLKLPAVWMSFAFFLTSALGFGGVQTFGPEAARLLHDVQPTWVALCLTAFMLASAAGTLAGGFVAADPSRAEKVVALGYAVLAYQSLQAGLGKLEINQAAIARDLDASWEVLAEPIQTVMRRFGLPQPYEQLKKFTRGEAMTRELMQGFIAALDIPESEKQRLLAMTPASYTGKAAELARRV
jgi:MFS family permease